MTEPQKIRIEPQQLYEHMFKTIMSSGLTYVELFGVLKMVDVTVTTQYLQHFFHVNLKSQGSTNERPDYVG